MTNPEQDAEIRDALAGRDVPEHRTGFFDELKSQMSDVTPDEARSGKTTTNGRSSSHGYRWRYAWGAPVAAAAVVAALLAGSLNNDSTRPEIAGPTGTAPNTAAPIPPGEPTLAADVLRLASAKVASITALSGVIHERTFAWRGANFSNQASETKTQFRVTAKGDIWTHCDCGSNISETSYDATTGEERHFTRVPGNPGDASVITRAQDGDRATRMTRLGILTSSLRSLAQSESSSLKEVTYEGRPAWQLEAHTTIDLLGLGPDHYIVTVDKETLFPVHLIGNREGRPFEEATATDIQINPTFTPAQMQVAIPSDVEVFRRDAGHERVLPEDVKKVVGYDPFIPAYLPEGFTLSSVSANKNAGASGPEGSNEVNRNLVVLTYRRGLETLQVTTRSSKGDDDAWNDPHGYEGEPPHTPEKVKLTGGAFADLTADVIPDSTSRPHLWLVGARWLLTVVGDVGRDDLVKVAESVQSPSAIDRSINPATTLP